MLSVIKEEASALPDDNRMNSAVTFLLRSFAEGQEDSAQPISSVVNVLPPRPVPVPPVVAPPSQVDYGELGKSMYCLSSYTD